MIPACRTREGIFFSSRRRHTRWDCDWSSDVCSSDLIGNAAHTQLQLDVYGELMDALHHARQGGLASSETDWMFQRAILDHLEKVWVEPDEGIWEVRSGADRKSVV